VFRNPQMAELLQAQGHQVVEWTELDGNDGVGPRMASAIRNLLDQWGTTGLQSSGLSSPHTTAAATDKLFEWADRTPFFVGETGAFPS